MEDVVLSKESVSDCFKYPLARDRELKCFWFVRFKQSLLLLEIVLVHPCLCHKAHDFIAVIGSYDIVVPMSFLRGGVTDLLLSVLSIPAVGVDALSSILCRIMSR